MESDEEVGIFEAVTTRVKRAAPEPSPVSDELEEVCTRVKRQAAAPRTPTPVSDELEEICTRVKRQATAPRMPEPVSLPSPPARPAAPSRTPSVNPAASPVADFMEDRRKDAEPHPPVSMLNAIQSAARVVGMQLAGVARGQGEHIAGRRGFDSLSEVSLVTGPNEDERILFEAGPRISASSPGAVHDYPPCCLGSNCVSYTHHWAGLPPGTNGPVMMAALTPNELERLESGRPAPTDNFAGRLCLLDLWFVLLSITQFTGISSVLCGAPSAVVPRCPRLGDPARSQPTDDVYNPLTTVRPVPGSTSPFAQPFPLLRLNQVRFYRDALSGKWRASLEAYKLFGQDFRTGAARR